MANLNSIKTDLEKMVKGVWTPFIEDIELCIASVNSPLYKDARKRALQPYLRQIRLGTLDTDKVLDIIKPAVAEHLLLDWKNIEENGKKIPYSKAKAIEFLSDPSLAELYNFVLTTAGENDIYRQAAFEDGVKN